MKLKYVETYLCNEIGAYIVVVSYSLFHKVSEFFCVEQAKQEALSEFNGV